MYGCLPSMSDIHAVRLLYTKMHNIHVCLIEKYRLQFHNVLLTYQVAIKVANVSFNSSHYESKIRMRNNCEAHWLALVAQIIWFARTSGSETSRVRLCVGGWRSVGCIQLTWQLSISVRARGGRCIALLLRLLQVRRYGGVVLGASHSARWTRHWNSQWTQHSLSDKDSARASHTKDRQKCKLLIKHKRMQITSTHHYVITHSLPT